MRGDGSNRTVAQLLIGELQSPGARRVGIELHPAARDRHERIADRRLARVLENPRRRPVHGGFNPAAGDRREMAADRGMLFDFDRDGLVDIYLVNSLTVDTADNPKSARSALYRNLGDGTFEVVDPAGEGDVFDRALVARLALDELIASGADDRDIRGHYGRLAEIAGPLGIASDRLAAINAAWEKIERARA